MKGNDMWAKKVQAAFMANLGWPRMCKVCHGAGGKEFGQTHPYGSTTATEQLWDDCLECVCNDTCPRCGLKETLNEDGTHCAACDWDIEDDPWQIAYQATDMAVASRCNRCVSWFSCNHEELGSVAGCPNFEYAPYPYEPIVESHADWRRRLGYGFE